MQVRKNSWPADYEERFIQELICRLVSARHNRCPVQFKSGLLTREFAHAWALPKAEIHFNDAQTFVPANYISTPPPRETSGRAVSRPISFLKVHISTGLLIHYSFVWTKLRLSNHANAEYHFVLCLLVFG